MPLGRLDMIHSLTPSLTPSLSPSLLSKASHRSTAYARFDGKAVRIGAELATDEHLLDAHLALRDHVLEKAFPCVGAKSAFNRQNYRFGLFKSMGSRQSAEAVCEGLYQFSREFPVVGDASLSFIALFEPSESQDELQFEDRLWRHLQLMHDFDSASHPWAEGVDHDSTSTSFSFSIGSRAWFVVGLHPEASRASRRTAQPALVFNFHEQFERLKASGKYDLMKDAIRSRDIALQGTINPVLARFGESSEARQYSGRAVDDAWRCPFHARQGAN